MNISIALRGDNAIVIYDQNDPRSGVVIDTVAQAATLIDELNAAVAQLHGEEALTWARLRAAMEEDDPDDAPGPN